MKRLIVEVDDDYHTKVKMHALKQGEKSISAFIRKLLKKEVK